MDSASSWYFTISWLLEVYVGVSQRSAGDDVPAHSDWHDGSSRREFLIEHGLCHITVQVPYVQGGEGIWWCTGVHLGLQLASEIRQTVISFSICVIKWFDSLEKNRKKQIFTMEKLEHIYITCDILQDQLIGDMSRLHNKLNRPEWSVGSRSVCRKFSIPYASSKTNGGKIQWFSESIVHDWTTKKFSRCLK